MNTTVGLIGAGNMGFAMMQRLLDQGWAVAVCDIDPAVQRHALAAGATLAESPADLARDAELLIVAVVDAAQSEAVLFGEHGAASQLPKGGTVLLCPTLGPDQVESITARLATAGLHCIDSPMSGGPARARSGEMSLMLAAPAAVLARQEALLSVLSSKRFVISERPGDAARTKLVNNLLAAINLAGAAEVLALAERLGLDGGQTLDVIEQSSGQSWIGSDRMRRALAGDLAPRAHTSLLRKDSALALRAARQQDFDAPLGSQAAALFERACSEGLAGLDDGCLLDLLRRS
ncbi:MAG: NAD(P)-dependent oxidoreductase [Burkholderiaceae bacterium]|nr:NAD(P)-dependent oxidoreductase [Burkholderiaceae bacterium]